MKERKVLLTYEAIYDIVEAEEYILYKFGKENEVHILRITREEYN